jgi:hypothetical protein
VIWQWQIIVDRFGHVNILQIISFGFNEFCNAVGCRCGIISANGNEQFDVVVFEKVEVKIAFKISVFWLKPAHFKCRSSAIEDIIRIEKSQYQQFWDFVKTVPEYPPCKPMTFHPFLKNIFATLPTTVFIPGAGPPPQQIATAFFIISIIKV